MGLSRTHIIALTNQKGGCGKTTSTVSLAAACARLGLKVTVVDTDPQCAHPRRAVLHPGGVVHSGHGHRTVLRDQLGPPRPADDDPDVGTLGADQHETRQPTQAAADEGVQHLVEAGALVDALPDAGHPRPGSGRKQDHDVVPEHAVPAAWYDGAAQRHGLAPSFCRRLSRRRRES